MEWKPSDENIMNASIASPKDSNIAINTFTGNMRE